MIRHLKISVMLLVFCWTLVACSAAPPNRVGVNDRAQQTSVSHSVANVSQLQNGQYPVQQVTYDDGGGEYRMMLLNTASGQPSVVETTNLPMARLTDEQMQAGQKSYLKVEQGQPTLYLTEDFRIEYVHNVAETQPNPETGQPETVVVRQETSFWTPFAAAIAGQAVANWLFTPRYYMPPVYQPGVALIGYGGYGRSYGQAVSTYQARYNRAPAEVRNRPVLRTSGRFGSSRVGTNNSRNTYNSRPSGGGYGTNTLQRSRRSSPTRMNRPSGFGSNRGFSRGRRR